MFKRSAWSHCFLAGATTPDFSRDDFRIFSPTAWRWRLRVFGCREGSLLLALDRIRGQNLPAGG